MLKRSSIVNLSSPIVNHHNPHGAAGEPKPKSGNKPLGDERIRLWHDLGSREHRKTDSEQ